LRQRERRGLADEAAADHGNVEALVVGIHARIIAAGVVRSAAATRPASPYVRSYRRFGTSAQSAADRALTIDLKRKLANTGTIEPRPLPRASLSPSADSVSNKTDNKKRPIVSFAPPLVSRQATRIADASVLLVEC
jgi:hypothetical protein